MDIRNCSRCNQVFLYQGRGICPACQAEEEREFDKLRDFLEKQPEASLEEVSQATGVPVNRILAFLRDGRLISKDPALGGLRCQVCGAPVTSGRFCPSCADKLRTSIERGIQQDEKGKNAMHTWGGRKDKEDPPG